MCFRISMVFLFLIIETGLVYAQGPGGKPQPLRVSFSLVANLPTVDAQVNGVRERLVLDLGGYSAVAIHTDIIPSLNVKYSGVSDSWRDASGSVHSSRRFIVDKLKLGEFFAVAIQGSELDGSLAGGQNGYVGFGLLDHQFLVFDYINKELRIYARYSENLMNSECGGVTFPISVVNGVVETKLQTEKGDFIFQIDTGSTDNVFRPSALSDPKYSKITSVPFSKFSIGNRDFGRVRLPLREFNAPDVDGVLGTAFLNSKVFCVDIQNSVASFR